MYKKIKAMPVVLAIALMMTGCQSGDENLAKKDYSPLKYVTLGEYKDLEIEQIEEKKELTDEEKAEALEEKLSAYAEEKDITDRGAKNGDYLSMTYKCYQNGELIDESGDEEIDAQLGSYTFFDEDGEAKLMGCKPGDTKTVEIREDDGETEYTYTYEVTVNRVYESILPELDDTIAKEEGYDSAQAMETAVYQQALESMNEDYLASAKDELLQLVVGSSETNGYPQSLYDKTYEQMNSSYQDFFGISIEDVYGDDTDGLKSAIEETLVQELVVEALAEKENITVTQKQLDEYKESIVALYEYTDVGELEAEFTDEILIDSLLNAKVQDYLLANAKVTYVTEEEYYGSTDEDEEVFDDIEEDDVSDEEL